MVTWQPFGANEKGADCDKGCHVAPKQKWWHGSDGQTLCDYHYQELIAHPEPKEEPQSPTPALSAVPGLSGVEGDRGAQVAGAGTEPAAAEVTRKENIGAEPPLNPEPAPGSKAPSLIAEAVEELMGLSTSVTQPNKVWVCRRTDYGRIELAVTVNQLPGEGLSQQIDRARNAVYAAFEEERKR